MSQPNEAEVTSDTVTDAPKAPAQNNHFWLDFGPLLVFFVRGGSFTGLQDSLGVLAPIALCLGAHGVMFFFMGKSCHSSSKQEAKDE